MAYTGAERFKAQGLNDTLVYGTQSIASLGAGWLLFTVGWSKLVLIPVPLLLGLLVIIWKQKKPAWSCVFSTIPTLFR